MESPASALIAIDLALVPPEWVQERARRISRTLSDGGLQLDTTHLPHISLAQCFVWRAALPLLIERLSLVLRSAVPLPIRALAVVDQQSTISFLLDRTPELLLLHESLMDAIKEWEEEGGGAEAFYSEGEPPRAKDVDWVTNYRAQASYSKFIPHITLGFGEVREIGGSFDFVANEVGLYHLGRFCTCRVLLRAWELDYYGER